MSAQPSTSGTRTSPHVENPDLCKTQVHPNIIADRNSIIGEAFDSVDEVATPNYLSSSMNVRFAGMTVAEEPENMVWGNLIPTHVIKGPSIS